MLHQAKTLHGYKLNSLEGEMGRSKNSTSTIIIGQFVIWLQIPRTGLRKTGADLPKNSGHSE